MKEPILYRVVRPIIKFGFDIIYNPTYIGVQNIPKNGKIILAGNHTNERDCLLIISSTKRIIHFMGKHTLFKGFKKPIFKGMGVIPVNRTIKDHTCLENARGVLNNGQVIGIFPEGTTNETEQVILPFKIGAIKLAFDTNSYILPFTIKGKYKKRNAKITYGKPYKLESNDLEIELKKLEKIITKMLGEENENN